MWITWWSIMTCNCKKTEGLERLFLQLIKEKFTNLDKFSPLNYHKILTPPTPPFCSPYYNFKKKFRPLTCLVLGSIYLGSGSWTKKSAFLSSQTCLTRSANTVHHDSESISFLKPKIWNLLPNELKITESLQAFKNKIKY